MIITIEREQHIAISNNQLLISHGEDTPISIPLKDITAIVIHNSYTSLSIQAIQGICNYNILLLICNTQGIPQIQLIDNQNHYLNSKRLQQQIKWKPNKKLLLFRRIITQKITHQAELLQYCTIEKFQILLKYAHKVSKCKKIKYIKLYEAVSARIYFRALFGKNFKRFHEDEINKALNYGYAILRAIITKHIIVKGLNPTLGIEHHNIYNKFNLTYDIIEPFRPLVDYLVISYMGKYEKLDKDYKNKFHQISFQKIIYKGKKQNIETLLSLFINEVSTYLNGQIKGIEMPLLSIEDYKYNEE